jgi:hypothetical protein
MMTRTQTTFSVSPIGRSAVVKIVVHVGRFSGN